jgi:hypothetical protein
MTAAREFCFVSSLMKITMLPFYIDMLNLVGRQIINIPTHLKICSCLLYVKFNVKYLNDAAFTEK